jgi:outer membrane protein OmpA-like peptidoglycan-associated protein
MVALVVGGCAADDQPYRPVAAGAATSEAAGTGVEAAPQPIPGADKPTPNLADVPPRPKVSTPEERARLTEALIADREKRLHAGGPIPLQGSPEYARALAQPVVPGADAGLSEEGAGAAATLAVAPRRTVPQVVPRQAQPVAEAAAVGGPPPAPTGSPATAAPGQQRPGAPAAGQGQVLRVAAIVFAKNSTSLAGDDKAILKEVATAHRQYGGKVRLIAPVRQGDDPAKSQTGLDRAIAIARELVENGVDQKQIVVNPTGAPRPAGEAGETADRRVEILFTP